MNNGNFHAVVSGSSCGHQWNISAIITIICYLFFLHLTMSEMMLQKNDNRSALENINTIVGKVLWSHQHEMCPTLYKNKSEVKRHRKWEDKKKSQKKKKTIEFGAFTAEFKMIGPSQKITHIAGVKFLIPGEHFNKNCTILCCHLPPDFLHSSKRVHNHQDSRPTMCVIFHEGPNPGSKANQTELKGHLVAKKSRHTN